MRPANEILRAAGWSLDPKTRQRTHSASGRVLAFEILLNTPLFERIALPFVKNLDRLGVQASVRTVSRTPWSTLSSSR